MKIIILCKRRPQGRDLFNNPYGRFFYLAYYLAKSGHDVELILFSYRFHENQTAEYEGLRIRSFSLMPNPVSAIYKSIRICKALEPDWIIGFSDTYYGILAWYIAQKVDSKSLIDAYDNYESYIPFLKPLHWLWRYSLRSATLVTCAGPSLKKLIERNRKEGPIEIVPMTADKEFTRLSRTESRAHLKLPEEMKLIGYHGSISHSRDIEVLFSAVDILKKADPRIALVLSGRLANNVNIPEDAMYLGYLPDDDVPVFINCMNVLAVPNRPSVFGHFSYPVKLYEAMACQVPVVVAQTDSTAWILKGYEQCLVMPGDADAFAKSISVILSLEGMQYPALPGWSELGDKLEKLLGEIE